MGELLRFPDRGGQEGVGQSPAPGRRSRPPRAAAEQTVADIERLAGPAVGHRAGAAPEPADDDEEPRWAVPGVDDVEPTEPVSTRATRRAENVALAALARHDASEGEVRAKLVAKGLEIDDVESELARLRRTGLLDDAAFAERQVERLRERKGLGDSAIRSALRGRLVPQDVIDVVLTEQAEDEDAAEQRLQDVADDRARRLGSLPYAVAERRLTAYLMRKGFGGSAVRSATRTALEGAGIR